MTKHAPCPCGGVLAFGSSRNGDSLQTCDRCGIKPMEPMTEIPVVIPPEMLHMDSPATVAAICVVCERTFQTQASQPGILCSMTCRRKRQTMLRRKGGKPGAPRLTASTCPKCRRARRLVIVNRVDGRQQRRWRCSPCERAAWYARKP